MRQVRTVITGNSRAMLTRCFFVLFVASESPGYKMPLQLLTPALEHDAFPLACQNTPGPTQTQPHPLSRPVHEGSFAPIVKKATEYDGTRSESRNTHITAGRCRSGQRHAVGAGCWPRGTRKEEPVMGAEGGMPLTVRLRRKGLEDVRGR
jgi:hypothetical protein